MAENNTIVAIYNSHDQAKAAVKVLEKGGFDMKKRGMSAREVGLAGLGIPRDSILQYERVLEGDKFMVVAHGSPEEVNRAKGIIKTTGAAKTATFGRKQTVNKSFNQRSKYLSKEAKL
ncbi:MAG: hypothetical protein V3U06_13290 [Candidatus Binatia bacterium]